MKENGEIFSQRGDLFQKRVVSLLKKLGFKDILTFRYDLEFIGHPPSGEYIKPVFCPDGVISVEATTDNPSERKIKKFIKNVDNYNVSADSENKISGKILACDFKIPNNYIQDVQQAKGIFIWDIRMLTFLATKVNARNNWEDMGRCTEKQLDENSYYVFGLVKREIRETAIVKVDLFIENMEPLQINELKNKIKQLVNSLNIECKLFLPIDVDLRVHVLNDWVRAEDRDILSVFYPEPNEYKNITFLDKDLEELINGYGSAPWYVLTSLPH